MQETRIQSLGQEDPLEKGMATYSNILLWRIPWGGAWQAIVHRITNSRTTERLTDTHTHTHKEAVASDKALACMALQK